MTLAAKNLTYGYRDTTVGSGATLAIEAGEVTALLGPNGGGKTTLLKTMLGLLSPLGGAVTIDGHDLEGLSVADRAKAIGYVPQASASPFAFTASEIVLMGRTAHAGLFAAPTAKDRGIAASALDRLGIAHLSERPITMISGGERQLVLIARALAQAPRFLVLDEPTASLDFGNQGKVMRRLGGFAEEGLGVLFTTHDPNHAARFADRVALLGRGTILAQGPVREHLTSEALADLYAAPVDLVRDEAGRSAYLPG
ncbi:MAG: ABC transporter ATP-binding protein [Hyphomicrobiales bacterium]